jgi:ribonuclease-3
MAFGKNPYRELETRLGYRFKDRQLLDCALTHPSYRYENTTVDNDNQRLEFLGDAVLGVAAAAYLYMVYPDKEEGNLTTLRSQITSGRALAKLAHRLSLGAHLRMGRGEERSGGRSRISNLADALEAVVGAAYLDGGHRAAERIFKTVFAPEMDKLGGDPWAHNPKGKLQELSQERWKTAPRYELVASDGPPHNVRFTVKVVLPDGRESLGNGSNKQGAEAQAARRLLQEIL